MHLGSWYFPSAKSSPVCSSAMLEGAAVPAHVTGLAVWALDKHKSGQLVILCESTLSLPPKLFNAPTYFHHWHVLWSSANLLLVCSWSARVSTNEAWQTVGMRKPNGACTIERIETLENRQAPWKTRWQRSEDQEVTKRYQEFFQRESIWRLHLERETMGLNGYEPCTGQCIGRAEGDSDIVEGLLQKTAKSCWPKWSCWKVKLCNLRAFRFRLLRRGGSCCCRRGCREFSKSPQPIAFKRILKCSQRHQ